MERGALPQSPLHARAAVGACAVPRRTCARRGASRNLPRDGSASHAGYGQPPTWIDATCRPLLRPKFSRIGPLGMS